PAGLQTRFLAFIQEEAADPSAPSVTSPITPPFVLSSPLDGTSVLPPDVTVNQDTAAAPQNETAIAVDPNNSSRVVAAANDYAPCPELHGWRDAVQRTWGRLLGHVLLERRRLVVVLHVEQSE